MSTSSFLETTLPFPPDVLVEDDLQLYPLGAVGIAAVYNLKGVSDLVLTTLPREANRPSI